MGKKFFITSVWAIGAAVILSGGVEPLYAAGTGPDPAVVMTDKGAVRGVVRNGVREFKGIPYAQPPVGELRWEMPRAASAWSDILEATKYKNACPQVSRYGLTEASDTEDCLHLNVTAPYANRSDLERKRAVIVWFHGGAFVGGSSALYPLDTLAKFGDVIVVSMNYRLGIFGFTAHPAFGADHNGGYGLEDQRAALIRKVMKIAERHTQGTSNRSTPAATTTGSLSAEAVAKALWDEATKDANPLKSKIYDPHRAFGVDDLIHHKGRGLGVVREADDVSILVLFREGFVRLPHDEPRDE